MPNSEINKKYLYYVKYINMMAQENFLFEEGDNSEN